MSKYHVVMMKTAKLWATLSYAERKKVGCIISKDGRTISNGYNGTITGLDNVCEDENGNTKPSVVHAEFNAICYSAKSGISLEGSEMYITLSPCIECAKMIYLSGIKSVYYDEEYRNMEGIELLRSMGVEVRRVV